MPVSDPDSYSLNISLVSDVGRGMGYRKRELIRFNISADSVGK